MNQSLFLQRCSLLADRGRSFVVVTLIETTGSTPSESGAKMIVTPDGLDAGTVGGGRVEAKAIGVAQQMLADGARSQLVDWSLSTDVGMTCGGRVRLYFESYAAHAWQIVIFGAGHVTQALAPILTPLPCRLTCIDPRQEWLDRLPEGVARRCVAEPADEVDSLPSDAFVLCMTQGHRSDLPVLLRIFQSGRTFPYLGVIGSKAKAKVLRRELTEAGVPAERLDFHCPVGLPIGTNHPGEIAVSIAAQMLEVRDQLAVR